MKKFYSTIMMLAVMVAALSFTACGGDDDEDVVDDNSIVGVWECTSFDYSDVFGDFEVKERIKVGDRIIIKSDGTYSDPNDRGRWNVSGKEITFISDDDDSIPSVFTISKLTSKELILVMDYEILEATVKFKRVS